MKLHDYQEEAVAFLKGKRSAALFLDMGLGKTAVALTALDATPALVVAPKRVAEIVWSAEAALWRPDLKVAVASGTPAKRRAALDSGADIVVLGRDNLKDLSPQDVHKFNTVVLDELSSFKSAKSLRFKTMRRFLHQHIVRPVVWGLTGTPMPNGLLDLWSQIFLLDEGHRLGKSLTHYRHQYFVPGRQIRGIVTEWIPRPRAMEHVQSLLATLALSMGTEGRVHVPPVTVNRVAVPLSRKDRKVYEDFKRDLVARVDPGELHTAANAAVLAGKLSQITAGFLYSDDGTGVYDKLHTSKLDALKEVVEGALGSPVLVFYRFRAELAAIQEAFPEAQQPTTASIEAWNRGAVPMLVAHPASAGHGLNLQHGGHTIVWTTPSWDSEQTQQANKRLARQGQKHPVVIHYLVAPDTVDDLILARVRGKRSAEQDLLDYLSA